MNMNSAELAKRICDCLSDGYDDEEYRETTENQLETGLDITPYDIVEVITKLCERIEELEE